MKKEAGKIGCIAVCVLVVFVLWTVALCFVDVQAIGPQESSVGFATVNGFVHNVTGTHMFLYVITDWLGLVPLGVAAGFSLLGLIQWIKRKHLGQVDYSLLVLGGFYIVVMAVYVFFELVAVNYRPVLIDGILEASYPSSTTVLVMCVMPTSNMQLNNRIRNGFLKRCVNYVMIVFVALMVAGRLISGVHWVTDIIGGALLSTGLVLMYYSVSNQKLFRKNKKHP